MTRPTALWLNDPSIRALQEECRRNRRRAHRRPHCEDAWRAFRETRSKLKKAIKKPKRKLMTNALSSKKPKEVWKTINRTLPPSEKPLTINPDILNTHFVTTAERVTAGGTATVNLHNKIDGLGPDSEKPFNFRYVTHDQVLKEIRHLHLDCSTGPDNIPIKFIKLFVEHLASPLTHIIKTCVLRQEFPSIRKTSRISPVPKKDDPIHNDDYRPISILPALSKIYERLAMHQMVEYLTENATLHPNISAYRNVTPRLRSCLQYKMTY